MPVRVGLQYIAQWKESLEAQVAAYEAEPAETGKIVFYGPSYYTRWSKKWGHIPLAEALRGQSGAPCCINRGFGSSCAEHQLYYYPRMIRPLAPKVLVYCPTANNGCFGYDNKESFELAQRVVTYALCDFPEITVYIAGCQAKREMSAQDMADADELNAMLAQFAADTPRCRFFNPLSCEALRAPENFVADGVHFNQVGYDAYTAYFKEILKDELAQF